MKVYNVKEIADILGTNPETVRRWIRGGRLGADQESRKGGNAVTEEDLAVFLQKNPKYASLAQKSNIQVAVPKAAVPEVATPKTTESQSTIQEHREPKYAESEQDTVPEPETEEPALLTLFPADREEAVSVLQDTVTSALRKQERPQKTRSQGSRKPAEPKKTSSEALNWLLEHPSEAHSALRDQILEAEMLISVKKRAIEYLKDEIRQLEQKTEDLRGEAQNEMKESNETLK